MSLPRKPIGSEADNTSASLPILGASAAPPESASLPPIEEIALPSFNELGIDKSPKPVVQNRLPVTPRPTSGLPHAPIKPSLPRLPVEPPKPKVAVKAPEPLPAAPSEPKPVLPSTNQVTTTPSLSAVSDESLPIQEEDEDAELDRLLGLMDDDEDAEPAAAPVETFGSRIAGEESVIPEPEEAENHSTESDEISVTDSPDSDEDDSDDFDFDAVMRSLESENQVTEDSESEDATQVESEPESNTTDEDEEEDWESILSTFGIENDESTPDVVEDESPEPPASIPVEEWDDDDDEDEDDSYIQEQDDFVPPTNAFGSLPDLDTDDDDEEDPPLEDDFVPPANPFANPYEDEESDSLPDLEEDSEDDEDTSSEEEEKEKEGIVQSLKSKAAKLLSISALKDSVSDYFDKIKAELHDEDPPTPRSERDSEEEDPEETEEEEEQDREGDRSTKRGSGKGLFGFLSPVKTLYMGIVNLIFGVLSAILGILAKLPLIGFIFSAALGATQILRGIATYLPLVFVIGGLAIVSYFSVARDAQVVMPDNGGSTFTEFVYDSEAHTASGLITNTGDIIAEVQPNLTVVTIQPELNPLTWFMPSETAKCISEPVLVDIDATMTITVECSGDITGFLPRVTGELN